MTTLITADISHLLFNEKQYREKIRGDAVTILHKSKGTQFCFKDGQNSPLSAQASSTLQVGTYKGK